METFAAVVALVAASILLWAGLEKARAPTVTIATLRQLGAPDRSASAAGVIVLVELAVALGLIFRPDLALTQGGVVLLAAGFALAGLLALRRTEPIRCACFGAGGDGHLGVRQMIAFVPWVGGAAFLRLTDIPAPSASRAAGRLAVVGLAMASLRLIRISGPWRAARSDRRAARDTYGWLRP